MFCGGGRQQEFSGRKIRIVYVALIFRPRLSTLSTWLGTQVATFPFAAKISISSFDRGSKTLNPQRLAFQSEVLAMPPCH